MTHTELVPVFTGTLQNQSVQLVNARDLHAYLQIGKDFSNWIKDRIQQYGFIEGEDYSPILANRSGGSAGKRRTDYHLTLDTAKELAMVENNDQGRAVRRYFIRIEREAKQPAAKPAALPKPELPAIDVRALLTTGLTTPTLPLPDDIQSAINRRAWAMSHDVYELLRQHFARRVAYYAVSGYPNQQLDKARALEVIADGDLGKALAYTYYTRLGHAEFLARTIQHSTEQLQADIRAALGGPCP